MSVSQKDRDLVRALAERFMAAASLPRQAELIDIWKRHNRLERVRPLVLNSPEGVWAEFVPAESIECEDPVCRGIEHGLRAMLYHWDHLRDDSPRVVVGPATD